MIKIIIQKLKPHSNLLTIRQYSSINEMFNYKECNLHILAAFSNAHLKNEVYYLTASTIQSETPIKFRNSKDMEEGLKLLNMEEIYFFNINNISEPGRQTVQFAIGKRFIFTTMSYNEFFSSETISEIFKESRFNHNNIFFYFAKSA